AAHPGGGHEAGEIADDATAERDDDGAAVGVEVEEAVVEALCLAQALAALAVGHEQAAHAQTRAAQPALESGAVAASHLRHRDDHGAPGLGRLGDRGARLLERLPPEPDRIAAGPELHADRAHGFALLARARLGEGV